MQLVVDLARVTVVLAEADHVEGLALRVGAPALASARSEADVHRLGDVLASANIGRLVDPGSALVRADAVRFHAAGQVDDGWVERFAQLCRFQSTDAAGGDEDWVEVPVCWPEDPPPDAPDGPPAPEPD